MFKVNDNFTKLPSSYLFSEVARRVRVYTEAHPEAEVIRMGIGDVTARSARLWSTLSTARRRRSPR